ncbi:NAD(P)-dependent oxidoreductase, partial [Escherichia coli]|uniref:NAD(P)-dependent oxidoreductase n=2 Tax=Pseudomonadota TaxID=1224 RepID=UPI001841EF4A
LGPKGFLINVARGKLVDEAALIRALADGTIAGAGLDVFANEPHVPAALLELDRVVVQPHRASATHETREEMG